MVPMPSKRAGHWSASGADLPVTSPSSFSCSRPPEQKSPQAGLAEIERGRAPLQEVLRNGRDLDVDLEQRDRFTALDPHLDLIRIHRDVLADRRDNILAQNGDEVSITRAATLVHQQDLEPMLSGLGRSLPAEKVDESHAALRPKSLLSSPL